MDYAAMPDEELMDRVRLHNDNRAAHELFVRDYGRLVRRFRFQGENEDVAEELAQETFFRVLRARNTWRSADEDPDRNFRKWIDMIADNVRRDLRRERIRHRLVELGVDPVAPQSDDVDYVAYARIMLDQFHGLDDSRKEYVRAWLLCGASAKGNVDSAEVVKRLLDNPGSGSGLSLDEAIGVLYALVEYGARLTAARQLDVKQSDFYAVCSGFMERFAERVRRLEGLNDVN